MQLMQEPLSISMPSDRKLLVSRIRLCGAFGLLVLLAALVFTLNRIQTHKQFIERVTACGGEVSFKNISASHPSIAGAYSDTPSDWVFGFPVYNVPIMIDFSGIDRGEIDWKVFMRKHPPIERLIFTSTGITDKDVKELLGLTSLISLDLSDNQIEVGVLYDIASNLNLKELALVKVQVSGASLLELKSAKQLERIYLSSPHISRQDIARLRKEMPWCDIVVERKSDQ